MPVWMWFFVAALVLIAITGLLVIVLGGRRRRTSRLQKQFGPEYARTVAETGEQRAAEKELIARTRNRDKLDIRPLTLDALDVYSRRWRHVQTAFVDSPASALDDAERLLTEVMRERGYPVDDFDQRAADISVDHPAVVQNYRSAHAIHLAEKNGDSSTEEQRQAFVHYRALFGELLEHDHTDDLSQRRNPTREASA